MRDIGAERKVIDEAIAGKTLCSVFAATVERLGDAAAFVAGERTISWNAYRDEVRAVALGLSALGFPRGGFAVTIARNSPEHVIGDLGVVHAGGVGVSIYTTSSPEQVQYIASHCDARVAFVDREFLPKVEAVRAALPALQTIVLLDGSAPGCVTWADLVARGRAEHARDPGAFDASWRQVRPDDTLTLIYTSGTTGHPKGVIDTHRSALWVLESVRQVARTTEQDHAISYLPLAHAADRFLSYYGAIVGGHVVYPLADLAQLLPTMLAVRPTFFGGVPRVWEKLHAGITAAIASELDEARKRMVLGALELARSIVVLEQRGEPVPAELATRRAAIEPLFAAMRAKLGLDRARLFMTGAAPTPREVLEFFAAIGVKIPDVWGMSELGVIGTMNPPDRIKIGTIGPALPGVEARLAPDGELQVRGGLVMRGYYKDPERTAETIDADGWLSTGDVATVDADGYYTIIDRKKELIITAGGKNLSPANLEALLKAHPLIGQACVIGDNRPYVVGLIVLDGQMAPAWAAARGVAAASIAELASHDQVRAEIERAVAAVNERVSRVEHIRRWTILPIEWTAESEELTPTMKLKRRVIAAKYVREIDELYA